MRDEVAALNAKSRKKTLLLVDLLRFIAGQIAGADRNSDYEAVVTVQLAAGDIGGAQETVESMSGESGLDSTRRLIAEAQALSGDVAGAQKTVLSMGPGLLRSIVEAAIAEAQLRAGETASARATFASARKFLDTASSQSESDTSQARIGFAIAQINAGDSAGAQETLAPVPHFIEAIPDGYLSQKSDALARLAEAQVLGGDISIALKTIGRATKADGYRHQANLAGSLAKTGHIDAALRIAALIPDVEWTSEARRGIAVAQARAEDIAGAQNTAALIEAGWANAYALAAIAEAQLRAGDSTGARRTLVAARTATKSHPNAVGEAQALTAIAETQIRANDGAEAELTLDAAQSAGERIENGDLWDARGMARGNVHRVEAMLGYADGAGFDWLNLLAEGDLTRECPLNAPPFLDLDSFIRAPSSSGDPKKDFETLKQAIAKVVQAQNVIGRMLKEQSKKAESARFTFVPAPSAR